MKTIHIIYNPSSGYGQSNHILHQVMRHLDYQRQVYFKYPITEENTSKKIIQKIENQPDLDINHRILVIGGDGTLHHVINAIYACQLHIPIAYIPSGTGNDFARAWQKDKTVEQIIDAIIHTSEVRNIPMFIWTDQNDHQGVIINSMGFGLDAIVNYNTRTIVQNVKPSVGKTLKKLNLVYFSGLITALKTIPHFDVEIWIDDEYHKIEDASIATIVNNPYLGGGIMIDSLTKPYTEEIAFIAYHHVYAKSAIELLNKVLIFKNQHTSKYFSRYSGSKLRVKISSELIGQVDGEAFSDEVDRTFEITHFPFIKLG